MEDVVLLMKTLTLTPLFMLYSASIAAKLGGVAMQDARAPAA